MPKYFFDPLTITGGTVSLGGDIAHHLANVLRKTPGDEIILCDGTGLDYIMEIKTIEAPARKPPAILLQVVSTYKCETELPVAITLYQGLPKGDKLELIVQKAVELGVSEIVPVETLHAVAKHKRENKADRYQRIAEAAAGQSMRGIVPIVHPPMGFADAVARMGIGATIVAYEREDQHSLAQALNKCGKCDRINLWVGPEGGFHKDEITKLENANAQVVSLGKRILRTETAAIALLAQVGFVVEGWQ